MPATEVIYIFSTASRTGNYFVWFLWIYQLINLKWKAWKIPIWLQVHKNKSPHVHHITTGNGKQFNHLISGYRWASSTASAIYIFSPTSWTGNWNLLLLLKYKQRNESSVQNMTNQDYKLTITNLLMSTKAQWGMRNSPGDWGASSTASQESGEGSWATSSR